jgi:L-alanine-DL-glutamate epimerase-like enolase superfamily enzyme
VQHDDLDGHARLAQVAPMRIAGAEFAATVQECREWLKRGKVDVLQPDVNRCGGLTELRRIADLAFHHGAEVVTHGWKTRITPAAQRHFQAATPCCLTIVTCHPELCESILRSSRTADEASVPRVRGAARYAKAGR